MKKILLLMLLQALVLAVVAQGDGQQQKKKKKSANPFYASAGLTLNRITGDYTDDQKPLLAFQLGVGARVVDINQNFGVDVGVFYGLQGAKYKDNYGTEKELLSYINIPIVAQYTWTSGFFVSAGVQPGFLVSAKSKYEDETEDIKEYLKKVDLAVPVGLGYSFKTSGNQQLEIGAYVAPGLLNLADNDEVTNHNFVGAIRTTFRF